MYRAGLRRLRGYGGYGGSGAGDWTAQAMQPDGQGGQGGHADAAELAQRILCAQARCGTFRHKISLEPLLLLHNMLFKK